MPIVSMKCFVPKRLQTLRLIPILRKGLARKILTVSFRLLRGEVAFRNFALRRRRRDGIQQMPIDA